MRCVGRASATAGWRRRRGGCPAQEDSRHHGVDPGGPSYCHRDVAGVGNVDVDVVPGALLEVCRDVGGPGTRPVVDGYRLPPADSVPVHDIYMDGPAVRGREAEMESAQVCVLERGGMAGGGARCLQSLDRGCSIAPEVATALVEDKARSAQ